MGNKVASVPPFVPRLSSLGLILCDCFPVASMQFSIAPPRPLVLRALVLSKARGTRLAMCTRGFKVLDESHGTHLSQIVKKRATGSEAPP